MIDFNAIESFLTEATGHYETSAPTVSTWLDNLYLRVNEDRDNVRLSELQLLMRLKENGVYAQPNYAANIVFHLQTKLGQDTTGHAGF